MNTYIRDRLLADATGMVARAKAEEGISHSGVRGRFRELLVHSLLTPWLPPYAGCGTGVVVDEQNRARSHTQDDIVVFDRSLVPPVLAQSSGHEGVFPYDGVLARIEVKSRLTKEGLRTAVVAAKEILEMTFSSGDPSRLSIQPINCMFAFGSDLGTRGDPDDELRRLLQIVDEYGLSYKTPCLNTPGPIGALCVVGRGAWFFGGGVPGRWLRAVADPCYEILCFIGVMSNTCFAVHDNRTGYMMDPKRGAGGGIGNFVLGGAYEESPVQTE